MVHPPHVLCGHAKLNEKQKCVRHGTQIIVFGLYLQQQICKCLCLANNTYTRKTHGEHTEHTGSCHGQQHIFEWKQMCVYECQPRKHIIILHFTVRSDCRSPRHLSTYRIYTRTRLYHLLCTLRAFVLFDALNTCIWHWPCSRPTLSVCSVCCRSTNTTLCDSSLAAFGCSQPFSYHWMSTWAHTGLLPMAQPTLFLSSYISIILVARNLTWP